MAIAGIPEVINDFNLYKGGSKLIGTTGEVTLPDFENMVATISGNGILGEYEAPIPGHFSAMEIEIPFSCVNDDYFKFFDVGSALDLTLRGAIQTIDKSKHSSGQTGMRVVIKGRSKKFTPGTVKQREAMNANVGISITFIMIEMDGKERVRLDKLNGVYKVNGKDMLAKIKKLT